MRLHPSRMNAPEKQKALNFPISKITIGYWTYDAIYQVDLMAKFYFANKKLIWESLGFDDAMTTRLKRKIEINWCDVLSFQACNHPHDKTEILIVELRKPPKFFVETNNQRGKQTQWQNCQDFTLQQSASSFRRHTLHFAPGVLETILQKLVSGNSFWSELLKVRFPTLPESLHFDIEYGNVNNNNNNNMNMNNSFTDRHDQTLSFNDNIIQGIPHGRVEQITNAGILGSTHEHYNSGGSFLESQTDHTSNNSHINDTRGLLGSQAYGDTIEPMSSQVGPYQCYLTQQGEIQNMDHANINYDDQYFTGNNNNNNNNKSNFFSDHRHDQTFSFSDNNIQGILHGRVEETTQAQLCPNEWIQQNPILQINSQNYNNIVNQLPGTHGIQNTLVNEVYKSGESQAYRDTTMRGLLGSQAYRAMIEPVYPQVGPNEGYVTQQAERQNMFSTNRF